VRWGDVRWYYDSSPGHRLAQGQQALHLGKETRASAIVDILAADGYSDHAALLQGEILFRRGKALIELGQAQPATSLLRDAVSEFNKIRDQGPIRLESAGFSGQCFLYLKQYREAERVLRFVLGQRPDDVEARRALAAVYFDQGALLLALEHLERVAELDDADARPYRLLGLIYKDLENYAAAVDCYRKALARELRGQPASKIQIELAECLSRQNGCDEALQILELCQPQPSDAALAAALKGACLRDLGRAAEAAIVLDTALAQWPSEVVLLRQRAILHLEAKEAEAGVTLLKRALDLDRSDYTSRYQLGLAYRALGRTAEADGQFRLTEQTKADLLEHRKLTQEAASKPWDAGVRQHLATLCEKLGRFEDAAQWSLAAAACSVQAPASATRLQK
jgi:tetratricopeptide (TPR) repeat protein